MRRRDFGKIAGGIVAGGLGVGALTRDTQAVAVGMNGLDVANAEKRTSRPVNGAHLTVNTAFSWKTTTTPTRAVLRLDVTYAGETEQLAATKVPGQLAPQQSGEHTFHANLLDHSLINAPDLTPSAVGETATLTFDVGVTMSVSGESGELGSERIEDTARIEVSKQQATIETNLSGEGGITVSTSTPA